MPPQTLRIFVSSPGDVAEERVLAARVIHRVQEALAATVVLEPIFWEHEPLRATATFQAQLVRPSDTDIVICILWSRLGTRLPAQFTRPDGSRYASGTEYELEDAAATYRQHGRPDLLVYRKMADPVITLKDTQAARDRLEQMEALQQFVTKWFHDADEGTLIAAFHPFDTSTQFEEILEVHLRKLIEHRVSALAMGNVGTSTPPTWTQTSPFRGLEVFDVEHAPIFFGRTRAVADVLHALRQQAAEERAFLLILGMSGVGKSSLLRAGVVPTLTQPGVIAGIGLWRWGIFQPRDAPADLLQGIARLLLDRTVLPELAMVGVTTEGLRDAFQHAPEQAMVPIRLGLTRAAEALAAQERLPEPPAARLVVVVDQMEELFTLTSLTQADREAFMAVLAALASSGVVWIIGSMRSDFAQRIAELPSLITLAEGWGQYHLLPPRQAEISQIIRHPARVAGLTFEVDAATGISLDALLEEAAAQHPEALPLLEFTLDELFKQRRERHVLTMSAYHGLGGLEGALRQRAEATFQALSTPQQAAVPSVIRALVTLAPFDEGRMAARAAPMETFPEGTPSRAVVEAFLSPTVRLFVADGDGAGARVRVAHEALFVAWERARALLHSDHEFLRTRQRVELAAVHWEEEDRSEELLLPLGKPLAEAEELLPHRRNELSPEAVAYIERSSTVQREKERLAREAAQREANTARLLAQRRQAIARAQWVAAVCFFVSLVLYGWLGERYWSPVRHVVFDAYQRFFPRQVDARFPVVIVDIDEQSLEAFGQWPWPRTRLARLLETVRQLGALAVGLDMVMPEPDRMSPSVLMAARPDLSATLQRQLAELPSNDVLLAETLRRVPTVVGRVGLRKPRKSNTPAADQTAVRIIGGNLSMAQMQTYVDHITNVAPLAEAASGHGYLNASPDADGVVRLAPLLLSVQGELAPALALELLRVAIDKPWYDVFVDPRGIRGVQIGTSVIPTDPDGRIRVYYSRADGRRRLSARAVLKGEVGSQALARKVVLLGVTGVGLTDVAVTPVAALMDGVEVQAQVVENILAGTRLVRPSAMRWLEFGTTLVAGGLVLFVCLRLPGRGRIVIIVAMLCGIMAGSVIGFVYVRFLFDPSFPVATVGLLCGIAISQGDPREVWSQERRHSHRSRRA